jgi:hypothetical protein
MLPTQALTTCLIMLYLNLPYRRFALVLGVCSVVVAACKGLSVDGTDESRPSSLNPHSIRDTATVRLTKWFAEAPAALSFTYDHGWGGDHAWEHDVERLLADSALPMDFDWTPHYLSENAMRYAQDSLKQRGIAFFGHGFYHVNTDALSEDSARWNFAECRRTMLERGIKPVSYAYPGGYGYDAKTRRACKDAGFLSGRLFTLAFGSWIVADDATEPTDWYALPSVPMFSEEHQASNPLLRNNDRASAIHNTAELTPLLDGTLLHKAWLILTYHPINETPDATYRLSGFRNDVAAAKARPFWIASMNTVTLYLRERAAVRLETAFVRSSEGAITEIHVRADDDLPDDVYDAPLTIALTVPLSWREKRILAEQNGTPSATQKSASALHTVLITIRPNQHLCRITAL